VLAKLDYAWGFLNEDVAGALGEIMPQMFDGQLVARDLAILAKAVRGHADLVRSAATDAASLEAAA
jgi:hypothetical protein